MGPGGPAGVQLMSWSALDPYIQTGSPIAMAEGGTPERTPMMAIAEFLKNSGNRSAPGGSGNRPPDARGGVISTINSEVDAGMNAATDPRFAAMDPRTRAIAKINERLQQQASLSGAQNSTASIMGRGLSKPGLATLAPDSYTGGGGFSRFVAPRLADGGRLIDLLKKTGRGNRWDTLRENPLKNTTKENAMFPQYSSETSPLLLYGGMPDWKLKSSGLAFAPRSRQRWMMFDSTRPDETNHATELGSLASNMGKRGFEDLIDLDIKKPHQRGGYGSETLALMLSQLENENDPFKLWDVKKSAKPFWESRGAQLIDKSKPFSQTDLGKRTSDGFREVIPGKRNNNYAITPGDFLDNVDKFSGGGEVGMSGDDAMLLGAGLAASRLRPRHINRMARPFSRALAKPVLGMESVTGDPLTRPMSDMRYDFARKMTPHPYADLPVHRGQGAWMGDKGMEYNPLYSQELPRRMGKLIDDDDALYYAGQMGENLEQAATPVSRFVPHLMNTPEDANAMMIPDVNNRRLRELATQAGPDWVTAHRPGNKAMMFPLGEGSLEGMAGKLGVQPRYGRSDADVDRVLLSRKPLGYESALYSDVGAMPRNESFKARERQALAPSADRLVETFNRFNAAK